MTPIHFGLPALALSLLVAPALFAQGQTRPIASQTVIDSPGSYVLNRDIAYNPERGAGIMITASGVTLDLNGYEILGPGGLRGTAIRVLNAQGVTVKSGSVANSAFGVVVEGSANVRIAGLNIRGQGLMVTAPPPETGVMIVQSRNVVVEGNAIYNTGLGIFVRGGQSWGNRIANNTLTAGMNGLLGICYNPAPSDPQGPVGDLITGNLITNYGVGLQFSATSRYNVARLNTVVFTSAAYDIQNATNIVEDNTSTQIR